MSEELTHKDHQLPSSSLSLLGRAIRYLSIREYSEFEIKKKLLTFAPCEEVNQVIQKLKEKGYLSDIRFAESLRARKSEKFGSRRIAQELKQHQLDPEILNEQLQKLKVSESERCFEIWQKKFGEVSLEPKEIAKQIRFLANKGFSQDLIMRIVKGKTLI